MTDVNKNFKVRHGLTVGEDKFTVDAATGDTVIGNDLTITGNDIKKSGGTTVITFSGTNLVQTAGDILVGGNTIRDSGNIPAIELSGANVTTEGNLTVKGDLTVQGTTTTLDTQNLVIEDNTILLNKNETGGGVTAGSAGIGIERGTLVNTAWEWNESQNWWNPTGGDNASDRTVFADGLIADTTLATNGTALFFNYDDGAGADVTITAKKGGGNYAAVRLNIANNRWETTVNNGSTWIEIPNQDLDTTADVNFNEVTVVKSFAAGNATLGAGGEVTTISALSATGTVSGTTPTIGVRAENATSGYGSQVLVVDHGQNRSGGGATTAGNPQANFESTRGTAASPTATGANDTLGVMQWGGYDGTRGLITGINGGSVQMINLASEAYTNDGTYTTRAGGQTFLRTQPLSLRLTSLSRQNLYAQTWSAVASAPPTQNIIWNSSTMTTQYDTAGTTINGHGRQVHQFYHPQFQIFGVPAQSTGNVDNGNLVGTNTLEFYTSRQSGWSGRRDAVENADTLAQIRVFGQTGTNSTGTGAQTGTLGWNAVENFTTSVRGSQFYIQTGDIGANTLSTRLTLDSDNANFITEKTTFRAVPSANANFGGEISQKVGLLNGATEYDKTTELSVTALTTDGTKSATYETKTNRFNGTNYSPTQTNDQLGRFTFLGNYGTGTTPLSVNAAGTITVRAAENFTATASGTSLSLTVNKLGTNTGLNVLDLSSTQATYRSDAVAFQDSSLAPLKGGKIDYARVFGCFHKIANVTAAAANTVYEFDWYTDTTAHVGNQGVTVTSGNPTRVNIDTAGSYTAFVEMQVKNTVSANRTAWIWLAKNGTDIAETRIKVEIKQGGGTDAYQLINKLWLLEDIAANDYVEVRFAVDNTSGISLEYEAAQTSPFVMPAQPSATITILPVGA